MQVHSFFSSENMERDTLDSLVLIFALGLLNALKYHAIDTETCEVLLFNPYTIKTLEKNNVQKEALQIIRHGLELSDVDELIPDKLIELIVDMECRCKELLLCTPNLKYPIHKVELNLQRTE